MPSVDNTWVRSAGPRPVNRYTLLKSPSVQIIESSVQVRYSVRTEGQVMKRNFCHQLAPSTSAASNRTPGVANRPVIRISVQNGNDFQICTRIAIESAIIGSLSQFGPSSPVNLKISWLITPHSGWRRNRPDRIRRARKEHEHVGGNQHERPDLGGRQTRRQRVACYRVIRGRKRNRHIAY